MSSSPSAVAAWPPYVRRALRGAAAFALIAAMAIAAGLAWGGPKPLPPLRSIGDPFQGVRFDDMPALRFFTARDGTPLAYRRYNTAESGNGNGKGSVMLVHGSSANSNSVHPLAQSLLEAGYTVYAFDIRGHGKSGLKGQVRYIGQLDDDLEDFVNTVQPARPRTLLGFSSGAGFALRVAGSPRGAQFDTFLFMAPYIHYQAMTNRSGASAAWAAIGVPRLVSLLLLNRVGVAFFNDLPVLNFAVSDSPKADLVQQYSYALALSFQPPDDYRSVIRSISRPAELVAGGDDELFYADRYRPLLDEAGRSDIPVTVVPATGHVNLTLSSAGRAAAVAAVRRLGEKHDGLFSPGYYSLLSFKTDRTVMDTATPTYTSFNGHQRIASGSLPVNALAVKHALAKGVPSALLCFCDQTGQVIDIDTRGSDAEVLARLPPAGYPLQGSESVGVSSEEAGEPRGRGRPKLGVVAREVTLLPRHWDWLAAQPGGASVTLRKLVDEARRASVDRDRQRQANERAYHFMSTMAGDMAGFEEASRALFANDADKFRQQTEAWPSDVRDYARRLAYPLALTQAPSPTP